MTRLPGHAVPVTAFPDGSGTTGRQRRRSAGYDGLVVCFELPAHLFDQHGERSAHRRYTAIRRAERPLSDGFASGSRSQHSRHPVECAISQHDADLRTDGYQQLGSPNNTASDFSTSVTQIADSLTWLNGRHTMKMGFDWRWERLNVRQPPGRPDRLPSAPSAAIYPESRIPARVRELSAGTGADLCHRPTADGYSGARTLSGVLHPGRLESVRALDAESGASIHAEFPIYGDQRPDCRVQSADTAARLSRSTEPVPPPLQKDNFGPRIGAVYRLTDKTIVSSGYGKVWIEMAGITTPFTTPNFPFLQTVSLRTLDNIAPAFVLAKGPTVTPSRPTPTAGLGQGVFTVDGTSGRAMRNSGMCRSSAS